MALREYLVVVSLVCVSSLHHGWIAFRHFNQSPNYTLYAVTNGHWSLDALVSPEGILKYCDVTSDPVSILDADDVKWRDVDEDTARKLVKSCEGMRHDKRQLEETASQVKATTTEVPFVPEETGDPAGAHGSFAIFPGTKWCGLDNKATSYDDLGEHRATDSCCRTHDHCPYFIDHFETKYHYRNPYPWTMSYCNCDTGLYNCLKAVKSTAADEVGDMFFGLLDVKCFNFEDGDYCSDERLAGLWCEKHVHGMMAVPTDFPYKWANNSAQTIIKSGLVG
ncbi:uncharacterized protein LOC132564142 [Ylistrum balloti]|uniref:uncharacterized protein LOC132564142 n=1 Tax=Ylistrum balloti TaxID=509963 RepID=UPI002905E57A|nr:uncharacterized protein LOC132564142 [Ylistrum balloti]